MPELAGGADRYVLDPSWVRVGGMSTVHRAACRSDGTVVACKIAKPSMTAARQIQEERDALLDLAARLPDADAWIVTVRDHGVSPDGLPFVVLPFYAWTLEEWAHSQSRPLWARLAVASQLCAAVARLHQSAAHPSRVVLHWDLKPSNFLGDDLEGAPRFVLSDLGGVRIGQYLRTVAGPPTYTVGYAPPEQMLPLAWRADPSVDVHALAATLYVLLAGRLPASLEARPRLLLQDAIFEIQSLQDRADRTADEERRLDELRRRDLRSFARLDEMVALSRADEQRLRVAILEGVGSEVADPREVAEDVAEEIIPVLRHALEPDPRRRLRDVRELLARVEEARERVVAERRVEVAAPAPPPREIVPVVEALEAVESRPPPRGGVAPRSGKRVLALVAASVMIALCTALPLAIWGSVRDRSGSGPPDAVSQQQVEGVPEPPGETAEPPSPEGEPVRAAKQVSASRGASAAPITSRCRPASRSAADLLVALQVQEDKLAPFDLSCGTGPVEEWTLPGLSPPEPLGEGTYRVQVKPTRGQPPFDAWIRIQQEGEGKRRISVNTSEGGDTEVMPRGGKVQVLFLDRVPSIRPL